VSFAAITLCVASQRVFIIVAVYFVIDSVRKLLDTHTYIPVSLYTTHRTQCEQFHCRFSRSIFGTVWYNFQDKGILAVAIAEEARCHEDAEHKGDTCSPTRRISFYKEPPRFFDYATHFSETVADFAMYCWQLFRIPSSFSVAK